MRTRSFLLLLLGIIFTAASLAQDQPAAQKNIMQFTGSWKLDEAKFMSGGQTVTGVYTFNCSSVCDNTGILAHEKFITKEMGTLNGENLFGYDPNTGQVHLYSIDNWGTAHDHYGYWLDNSHLFVQYQGVVEGKMYVEQIDFKFLSPNEMKVDLVGMLNGEVNSKFSGTFLK